MKASSFDILARKYSIPIIPVIDNEKEIELLLGSSFYREKDKEAVASLKLRHSPNHGEKQFYLFKKHLLLIYSRGTASITETIKAIEEEFKDGQVDTEPLRRFLNEHPNYKQIHILTDYQYRKPMILVQDDWDIFYTTLLDLPLKQVKTKSA